MRLLFIGHNGYGYPHTRVRCYHFARILANYPNLETAVLSFRDDLAPHKSEAAMYDGLKDREKLILTGKAILRLIQQPNTVLYIQKAHFHSAAPYFLHRFGLVKKYIFDYDDYDIPLSNFFYRGMLNRLFFGTNKWDQITWNLARNAVGCVAASHALADLLNEHNQHVSLISTGVDIEQFKPNDNQQNHNKEIVFLWNGLVWGKPIVDNLIYLFEVFHECHNDLPAYRINIIGGGSDWENLQGIVKQKFDHLPIDWKGWVKPQEMPQLLQNADVGLLPVAGNDLWLQSKSPTKLFEYMALGLPVIATAVGEVTHVIQHNQSGILANSKNEFSSALRTIANNLEFRRTIGTNARERIVSNYSLPVLGDKLYSFLLKLFPQQLKNP
jgi:glycosyltransferase involved in cell wall biosynthesis